MDTETRQTAAFEVELPPPSEDHQCCLCTATAGPMFIVRDLDGPAGRIACIAHVGLLMNEWDNQAPRRDD
jgi:hypothetical protein